MTLGKPLSRKVSIIFLGIGLFIFIGYLETFGAGRIYFRENPSAHCHFDQQGIVYTSKNIVRVWIQSLYKEKFIEMGGRFGHLKRFSESEEPKTILLIFIVCWGIAITFVLGAIFCRIVIEPLIKKRKLRGNEKR